MHVNMLICSFCEFRLLAPVRRARSRFLVIVWHTGHPVDSVSVFLYISLCPRKENATKTYRAGFKIAQGLADSMSDHGTPQKSNQHFQQQQRKPNSIAATAVTNPSLISPQQQFLEDSTFPTRQPGFRQSRGAKRSFPPPNPPSSVPIIPPREASAPEPSRRNERKRSKSRNATKHGTAATPAVAPSAAHPTAKVRSRPEPLIRPRTPPPRVRRTHEMHAYTAHAPQNLARNRPLVDGVLQNPGTSSPQD